MLLGSGELGKEFVISAKRLGHTVVCCDNYPNAPAMQVADSSLVFEMLDPVALKNAITSTQPNYIVPEIEAVATEVLVELEQLGYTVVPSAKAVNLTMNRDNIRNRATELGVSTARYVYAESHQQYLEAVREIGIPCVVKPVMSSSGKGQTIVLEESQVFNAWSYAIENMRGTRAKVIIEQYIDFDFEITLLTIKQHDKPTLFCDPIGHVQKNGDYQWSWQPCAMPEGTLEKAKEIATAITDDLGGAGLFGVEFFVKGSEVIFSELSPRPHDTGMVTLRSQKLSEFDLHLRAILDLPIHMNDIVSEPAASAVILSQVKDTSPTYTGIHEALEVEGVEVRIFNKPVTKINRRMGVVLANTVEEAKAAAALIKTS